MMYADPTGMERIHLFQHTDDQIKAKLKVIEKSKKAIDADKTKSKEQKKAEKAALDTQANTLNLEKQGNAMVNSMLAAMPEGERKARQSGDFYLLTDTVNDLTGWNQLQSDVGDPQAVSAMANDAADKNMFVLNGTQFESGTIFINAARPNIQAAMAGDRDFIAFGATSIRHEDVHRSGNRSELDGYTKQRQVLDRMPNAFSRPEVYQRFRTFLNSKITENGGKP